MARQFDLNNLEEQHNLHLMHALYFVIGEQKKGISSNVFYVLTANITDSQLGITMMADKPDAESVANSILVLEFLKNMRNKRKFAVREKGDKDFIGALNTKKETLEVIIEIDTKEHIMHEYKIRI